MNAGKLHSKMQEVTLPVELDVEIYVNQEIINEKVILEDNDDYTDYMEEVSSNILLKDYHYDFQVKELNILTLNNSQ